MRYVVRREFFGALVYDRVEDTNLILDEDFWNVLEYIFYNQGNFKLDDETINFLIKECFITNNHKVNFRLIDSGFTGETLSAPGRVHFYYTKKCNLNCKHCFTKDNNPESEMTFSQKVELLDEMHQLGVNEILIGGGEPFTMKDFPLFVEEALKRDIVTKVFTNGLLLNDNLIDRMKDWNIKYMSISVDGCNDDEYEQVRGVRGLNKIKEIVKKLKEKCSFTVAASVTINSSNWQNATKIMDLIYDMGFDRLKIRPVKPAGNVYRNKEIFPLASQYVAFIREAQTIWCKKYRDCFTLDFSWGDTRLIYDEENNCVDVLDIIYPYEGYGCFAGKVNIVVDSGGNALTCGFLPDKYNISPLDNVTKNSLKNIWENGKCFNHLRNIPGNDNCKKCQYYGICRGGCMARNLFFGMDINNVDPWCLKKHFPIKIDD